MYIIIIHLITVAATFAYLTYELILHHYFEFGLGIILFISVIIDLFFAWKKNSLSRLLMVSLVINRLMFFLCLLYFAYKAFYGDDRFDFYFLTVYLSIYSFQIFRQYKLLNSQFEQLNQYATSIQESYDHIIITNANGKIIFCNKGTEMITGYSREEILGSTPTLWGGMMDKLYYDQLWKTVLIDKQRYIGELKNKRKDGTVYDAEIRISPITGKNGKVKYLVGTERDISLVKQVDRMKSEFISLASHQLRTPLTAVKWFLELFNDGNMGKLTEKQKVMVGKIVKANEKSIEIVNSLLNISRIESGRLQVDSISTDIVLLAKEIINETKIRYIQKKQTVVLSSVSDIPEICTDPKLVRNILINLLTNAMKYSPDHSSINVNIYKDEEYLILEVKDQGIGIPKDQQSRVFNKFFRAENAVSKETDGSGLGLYLISELVKILEGEISFVSVENEGTVFFLKLPISGVKAKKGLVSLNN